MSDVTVYVEAPWEAQYAFRQSMQRRGFEVKGVFDEGPSPTNLQITVPSERKEELIKALKEAEGGLLIKSFGTTKPAEPKKPAYLENGCQDGRCATARGPIPSA
jgi:hypothetical protein